MNMLNLESYVHFDEDAEAFEWRECLQVSIYRKSPMIFTNNDRPLRFEMLPCHIKRKDPFQKIDTDGFADGKQYSWTRL